MGLLENKTNASSHPNIEEELDKMFEEFILKAEKSFRRLVDTIIEKMVAILSKFTVLYVSSYFVDYLLELKLLFYDRIFYYYTRILLILLAPPIYIYKKRLL